MLLRPSSAPLRPCQLAVSRWAHGTGSEKMHGLLDSSQEILGIFSSDDGRLRTSKSQEVG